MAHAVFVSYAQADLDVAEEVCRKLDGAGVECWAAFKELHRAGESWSDTIVQAIEASTIVLLLYSRSSNQSGQVLREIERAAAAGVTIAPVVLEEAPLSRSFQYYLGAVQWVVAQSRAEASEVALRSVKALLTQSPATALLPAGIAAPLGALRLVYSFFVLFGVSSAISLYLMFFNQMTESELIVASIIWVPALTFGVYGFGWARHNWRKSLRVSFVVVIVLAVFFVTAFNAL